MKNPGAFGGISLTIAINNVSQEIFNNVSPILYNGSIQIAASGGTPPYVYSATINHTLYQFNYGYFPGVDSGTYTITVTDANGLSVDTTVQVKYMYPQPALTAYNLVPPTSCDSLNGSFVLSASGGTPPYMYSIDGGNTFSSSPTFTGLCQGNYIPIVKDANGQITRIGPNPGSPVVGQVLSLFCTTCDCAGMIEYSENACGNSGYIKVIDYNYTSSIFDSVSLDGIHYTRLLVNNFFNYYETDGLAPGLYTVYIKIGTDINLLAAPIPQYCMVYISFVSVDASCHQSDGSLTVTATNGNPPYTYSIDGVNYQTSNVFNGLPSGMYSVSVKDAQGYISSEAASVFNKCPTVSAMETDEHCALKDGTITASGYKGTTPYQFSIDGVNFQASNLFSNLSSGNYTVTIRDINGFTGTTNITVNNDCIQIALSVTNETCGNANGNIAITPSSGSAPYQYSIDGINFQADSIFTNLKAGNYTISVKDATGIISAKDTTLVNSAAPQLSITTTPASCTNTNGNITINTVGGLNPFQYSIDGGSTFQNQDIFNGLDSATYSVIVKDANGCTASQPVQLTALPTPKFSIGNDTVLCEGNSLVLSAPQQAGYSYLWQDNSNGYSYNVISSGTYSVSVTNQYNCAAASSVNVRFRPLPVFDLGSDTTLCNGRSLLLQTVLPKTDTYLWSTGGTSSSIKINDPGIYWLSVSDSGCIKSDSITVVYKPVPSLNLGNDTTLCEGQTLLLNAANLSSTYLWQDGTTQATYTVDTSGTYSVTVSENGCDTSGTIHVIYITKPEVALLKDTTLCITEKLLLNAYYPQSSYEWQDGSTEATYTISQAGVYNVAISNVCGTTNDSIAVKYENCACKFYVPNAFSPNGDGKNDVFLPKYQCLYSDYQLKIYNRWGQLVFVSASPSNGWDGTMGGNPAPDGTYVWQMSYKDNLTGKVMLKNGTVVLIR